MKTEPKPIQGPAFRAVFNALTGVCGSESEAARCLDLKPAALQGWKLRRTIPAIHVERIRSLILARSKGVAETIDEIQRAEG